MKNKNQNQISHPNLSFSRTSLRATIGPQIRRHKIEYVFFSLSKRLINFAYYFILKKQKV